MAKGDVAASPAVTAGHAHELRHVGEARGFRIKGKAGRVLKTLDPSHKRRFIQDDFIPPGLASGRSDSPSRAEGARPGPPRGCPLPPVPLALKGPEFRFEF